LRIETIDELADVLANSQLTSLELEGEEWSVTLERSASAVKPAAPTPVVAAVTKSVAVPPVRPAKSDTVVEAAIVGVFHEAAPQITVGKVVRSGELLGTIDALTIRNDVKASTGGEIVAVHVEDGQPVEYGQPLFAIRLQGEEL
jgi:oxaloacetate decarboxylase (Na+ extruding) subunit alpha